MKDPGLLRSHSLFIATCIWSLLSIWTCLTAAERTLNPLYATIDDIQSAIASGIPCTGIVQIFNRRIHEYNDDIKALLSINPRLLLVAEDLDSKLQRIDSEPGPLHCVPIIVNDNIDVRGIPTTSGSLSLTDNIPKQSAKVIERLLAAGAVVIGKANMAEFSDCALQSWSSLGGLVRNPYDLAKSAYGPSGGSGAAVAAGFAVLGIVDSSIVTTAETNGIFGLRSTVGILPSNGSLQMEPFTDALGVLAKSPKDAAIALGVMAGEANAYVAKLSAKESMRIGTLSNFFQPAAITGRNGSLLLDYQPDPQLIHLLEADFSIKLSQKGDIELTTISLTQSEMDKLYSDILQFHNDRRNSSCYRVQAEQSVGAYFNASKYGSIAGWLKQKNLANNEFGFDFGKSFRRISSSEASDSDESKEDIESQCEYYAQMRARFQQTIQSLLKMHNLTAIVVPGSLREYGGAIPNNTRGLGNYCLSTNSSLRSPVEMIAAIAGLPSIALPIGYHSNTGLPLAAQAIVAGGNEAALVKLAYAWENVQTSQNALKRAPRGTAELTGNYIIFQPAIESQVPSIDQQSVSSSSDHANVERRPVAVSEDKKTSSETPTLRSMPSSFQVIQRSPAPEPDVPQEREQVPAPPFVLPPPPLPMPDIFPYGGLYPPPGEPFAVYNVIVDPNFPGGARPVEVLPSNGILLHAPNARPDPMFPPLGLSSPPMNAPTHSLAPTQYRQPSPSNGYNSAYSPLYSSQSAIEANKVSAAVQAANPRSRDSNDVTVSTRRPESDPVTSSVSPAAGLRSLSTGSWQSAKNQMIPSNQRPQSITSMLLPLWINQKNSSLEDSPRSTYAEVPANQVPEKVQYANPGKAGSGSTELQTVKPYVKPPWVTGEQPYRSQPASSGRLFLTELGTEILVPYASIEVPVSQIQDAISRPNIGSNYRQPNPYAAQSMNPVSAPAAPVQSPNVWWTPQAQPSNASTNTSSRSEAMASAVQNFVQSPNPGRMPVSRPPIEQFQQHPGRNPNFVSPITNYNFLNQPLAVPISSSNPALEAAPVQMVQLPVSPQNDYFNPPANNGLLLNAVGSMPPPGVWPYSDAEFQSSANSLSSAQPSSSSLVAVPANLVQTAVQYANIRPSNQRVAQPTAGTIQAAPSLAYFGTPFQQPQSFPYAPGQGSNPYSQPGQWVEVPANQVQTAVQGQSVPVNSNYPPQQPSTVNQAGNSPQQPLRSQQEIPATNIQNAIQAPNLRATDSANRQTGYFNQPGNQVYQQPSGVVGVSQPAGNRPQTVASIPSQSPDPTAFPRQVNPATQPKPQQTATNSQAISQMAAAPPPNSQPSIQSSGGSQPNSPPRVAQPIIVLSPAQGRPQNQLPAGEQYRQQLLQQQQLQQQQLQQQPQTPQMFGSPRQVAQSQDDLQLQQVNANLIQTAVQYPNPGSGSAYRQYNQLQTVPLAYPAAAAGSSRFGPDSIPPQTQQNLILGSAPESSAEVRSKYNSDYSNSKKFALNAAAVNDNGMFFFDNDCENLHPLVCYAVQFFKLIGRYLYQNANANQKLTAA